MIAYRVLSVALASFLVVACSGTDATVNSPDGAASDSGGNDAGGDATPGNDSGLGDPATIDLSFAAKCALFTPCGGDVVGTWDYSAGCTGDPWEAARKTCPALGVKSQKGTVKGRITFTANTVTRAATVAYTATLTIPTSCLAGGTITCADVATAFQKSFNSATCAQATGGCDCDVASTQSITGSGTNYTISGNQLTLQDGNKYDICVKGSTLQSTHVSGTNAESGVFELTKK